MAEDRRSPDDSCTSNVDYWFPRSSATAAEGAPAGLCVEQILAWADAHHAAHGVWPAVTPGSVSGEVPGAPGESWKVINHALALGLRGLPGDSSLAELLAEHRGLPLPDMGSKVLADKIWAWEQEQFPIKGPRRRPGARQLAPRLSVDAILEWADAHHEAKGRWPTGHSGTVLSAPFAVTWNAIQMALWGGHRGLPGGYTLRRLFDEHRNAYVRKMAPGAVLTLAEILEWADVHHEANGEWPGPQSGPVVGAPFELTWAGIQAALFGGFRGLPGGYTLHRLFAEHRNLRSRKGLPQEPLTIEEILAWADAHHQATGTWPDPRSGPVQGAPFELSWGAVNAALYHGFRRLPGGSSLNRLLVEQRHIRDRRYRGEPIDIEQVLAWADAHHAAHGAWPHRRSGRVEGAPRTTWRAIDRALRDGWRGQPGGSSLGRLLAERRGTRVRPPTQQLTMEQVLAWADAHHKATGDWPTRNSGLIAGTQGLEWAHVSSALKKGWRGLPRSGSLADLLYHHRQVYTHANPPRLTVEQVLAWADAFYAVHRHWPSGGSGPIPGAPGENWSRIAHAIARGHRGLPCGTSLSRFLAAHRRGVRAG
jgi:hypothetical protein